MSSPQEDLPQPLYQSVFLYTSESKYCACLSQVILCSVEVCGLYTSLINSLYFYFTMKKK